MTEAEAAFMEYITERGPELVKSNGDLVGYSAELDLIMLPEDDQFKSLNGRLETSFHEATHSTGHTSRLNRPGIVNFDHFGSGQYAQEELVAAMGAAMLLGTFGIDTETKNSAAYIAHWLGVLANDDRLVVKAAAQAQKSVDFVLGITHADSEATE
jgi:antirestriction protein ArdC